MGYDVAVIGGGVAGMSAAAFLARAATVVVIEAEDILSHHASGRSAALYTECYGPGIVPTLTKASRAFLMDRDVPLGAPRGVMFLAAHAQRDRLESMRVDFAQTVDGLRALDDDGCRALVPVLDPGEQWRGVVEPGAMDLDINGLEAAYRAMLRTGGGDLLLGSRVRELDHRPGHPWRIDTATGSIEADVVVNAAGAWGDVIAAMAGIDPLGLLPLRRSAFLTAAPSDARSWPMVVDVDERWYFRPEGPNLLGSAADEVPSEPVDARPADEDIALGIDRINAATTLGIRSVSSTWAGLRTFTRDRLPAVGPDPTAEAFFWLVGQGGYGIKTSPAVGELVAGLVVDGAVPQRLEDAGVTAAALAPSRFR